MGRRMKIVYAVLAAALLVLLALLGGMLLLRNYHRVDWRFYPRGAEVLDLRGKKISVEHYEALHEKMPHSRILWDVPFQEGTCSSEAKELTVYTLSGEDVARLDYVTGLTYVNAADCRDYDLLIELQDRHPGCRIDAGITLGGTYYPVDTAEIRVDSLTDRDVRLLGFLPELTRVDASGCRDYVQLVQLRKNKPECEVSFAIEIAGQEHPADAGAITVAGAPSEEILEKLPYFENLQQVKLENPQGEAENLYALMELLPDTEFTWELELQGIRMNWDDTEADLSAAQGLSIAEVDRLMGWLPELEQVFLGECGIDNEALAKFREEKRPDYKVVWTVDCGGIAVRTDADHFMPVKHNIYYFFNEDCYNLRYCEDMIAVDVGHMAINDISWVKGMPHLKYLILAHTNVRDITDLSTCKELLFLEIDYSMVLDYSPLLGCTALEDLNLGYTWGEDLEPIYQMTWLKNLWFNGRGIYTKLDLQKYLPEHIHLEIFGRRSVDNGWRMLKNYYDMRDVLGMHYMR